jgi:hypothetical protein
MAYMNERVQSAKDFALGVIGSKAPTATELMAAEYILEVIAAYEDAKRRLEEYKDMLLHDD